MNFTKKIFFLATLIFIAICSTSKETIAQTPENPEVATSNDKSSQGRNKGNREELETAFNAMVDSLQLSEQQREDFDFITTKYRAQMQQVRQNNEGDFAAMRPAMKELRDKNNAELKEVLTEEQFAQYQKWMEENRSRRGRGGPPRN